MIAVTGASGQLGRKVITTLLNTIAADNIVAAVRSSEKVADLAARGVQVRKADYAQPQTLTTALQGVEKLLLISSSEVGQREAQHQAVIDAARRAGVKLIAYTSLLHADRSPLGLGVEHRATEAALKASGIPFVILRNGWYSENYAASIAAALSHGVLLGAAGSGRIASASRQDYAEAAAAVLTTNNHAGKTYELAGDSAYTLQEFAGQIAISSGKTVSYQNLSEADFAARLKQAGLPEGLAAMLADSDSGAAKQGLFDDSHTLSQLIGRPTTPWQQTIEDTLKAL
ncbi:NAD(P)-dependent oxidoreductase [Erwinia sp. OLTSP20]|uniref:SDR family oxidoreductase n=1 Tax=unclassified Erwinia TaxID=2622719 RepID=UPI000C1A31DF|nr:MULTISPECIES: SDR family oxidoreductase [unclassified Erwinia]PIJ51707.1 NAD(P)-dependent oxidoreductase [Erwinia sp. OAMSP11]PIJ75594.1 NAD(P)-dependent oxidoreductase [Erwinia sp. OLSSP12]PIJ84899.1 NAD(P)-dependent oxidoreductase [Erwinia sp. OLCASP19]PIJ86678.1 NAD(P)-dependent oxidoreductase [Erwinia sp. OLMTSP26]PIJ88119.1 NAD(P)-dependent oxidoreductase [Erwinia sp. OLMDSP33]